MLERLVVVMKGVNFCVGNVRIYLYALVKKSLPDFEEKR